MGLVDFLGMISESPKFPTKKDNSYQIYFFCFNLHNIVTHTQKNIFKYLQK